MSSWDKNATDTMDIFLGNRLKNWAARMQPRSVAKKLLLDAASGMRSDMPERDGSPIRPIMRRFRALSVSLIDGLASQGFPAEMLSAVGEHHPTRARYERDIVLHSFPTGMGIYLLTA